MRRRWVNLLAVFIASIGMAIACASLSPSRLPSRSFADADSVYLGDSQAHKSPGSQAPTVAFPADYRQQFFHYATVDCPNSQIVRKMYVNRESLAAIAARQVVSEKTVSAGTVPEKTVPAGTVIVMETHAAQAGEAGRLRPNRLNNVFIREKRPQPNPNPDSGQWHSAWYSPSGDLVSDNQSSCIGCHTGLRQRDYLFTLPALITAAQTGESQYQQTEFGTSVCR